MQKKLLSTATLLVAAGIAVPAFAQFTISAGIQSTELQVNTETVWLNTVGIGNNAYESVASNENTNVGGELALGYQYNFNNTYNVALEIFGQLPNTQTDVPVLAGLTELVSIANEATASFDWITGIRLRPGYYVTPSTRFFVDGGIVLGGFEVEYDESFLLPAGDSNTHLTSSTDSKTLTGWRYGAGIEHAFHDTFVLGLDYTITQFDEYSSDAIEDSAEFYNSKGITTYNNLSTEYTPTLHTIGLNFKLLLGGKQQPQKHYEMRDK